MTENTTPRKYDKSKWGHGEWDNEPDRMDFIHAGFSCFILRNDCGNWCGYVGVPNTHPMYEVDGSRDGPDLDVHGGITYAAKCQGDICHVPEADLPAEVWWLGFDTAHYNDLTPSVYILTGLGGVYRNMEYTISEVKKLADQLKALEE